MASSPMTSRVVILMLLVVACCGSWITSVPIVSIGASSSCAKWFASAPTDQSRINGVKELFARQSSYAAGAIVITDYCDCVQDLNTWTARAGIGVWQWIALGTNICIAKDGPVVVKDYLAAITPAKSLTWSPANQKKYYQAIIMRNGPTSASASGGTTMSDADVEKAMRSFDGLHAQLRWLIVSGNTGSGGTGTTTQYKRPLSSQWRVNEQPCRDSSATIWGTCTVINVVPIKKSSDGTDSGSTNSGAGWTGGGSSGKQNTDSNTHNKGGDDNYDYSPDSSDGGRYGGNDDDQYDDSGNDDISGGGDGDGDGGDGDDISNGYPGDSDDDDDDGDGHSTTGDDENDDYDPDGDDDPIDDGDGGDNSDVDDVGDDIDYNDFGVDGTDVNAGNIGGDNGNGNDGDAYDPDESDPTSSPKSTPTNNVKSGNGNGNSNSNGQQTSKPQQQQQQQPPANKKSSTEQGCVLQPVTTKTVSVTMNGATVSKFIYLEQWLCRGASNIVNELFNKETFGGATLTNMLDEHMKTLPESTTSDMTEPAYLHDDIAQKVAHSFQREVINVIAQSYTSVGTTASNSGYADDIVIMEVEPWTKTKPTNGDGRMDIFLYKPQSKTGSTTGVVLELKYAQLQYVTPTVTYNDWSNLQSSAIRAYKCSRLNGDSDDQGDQLTKLVTIQDISYTAVTVQAAKYITPIPYVTTLRRYSLVGVGQRAIGD